MKRRTLRLGGVLLVAGGALWLCHGIRPSAAPGRAALAPASVARTPSAVHRFRAGAPSAARRSPDFGRQPEDGPPNPDADLAIEQWSDEDPRGLAAYARDLPHGPLRSLALACALPKWVSRDAAAASEWLASLPPDPELDPGAAALAMLPELPERRPDVSIDWATGITDAAARDATLQNIAVRWAKAAPGAVSAYLSGATSLRPADRQSLSVGERIAGVPPGQRGL